MRPFEEEDQEPVAVVRTLSDFALALTLVVLMLIGTRSAAEMKRAAETRAASGQGGKAAPELTLLLVSNKFNLLSDRGEAGQLSAAEVAAPWVAAHSNSTATVVLQFPQQTLAKDLHAALLELQAAFGTNLARIETIPQP
jgi:hypothetical protein